MSYTHVNTWITILLEKLNYFFLNEIKITYNENNSCWKIRKRFEHNPESRNWYNVFGHNIWEPVSRHQSRYHCPRPEPLEHAFPQWFDRK